MASLQRVHVRGHTYWRIVESHRVGGKPRLSVVAHLGKAMICSSGFRPPILFALSPCPMAPLRLFSPSPASSTLQARSIVTWPAAGVETDMPPAICLTLGGAPNATMV
jgi:hypothetical protein